MVHRRAPCVPALAPTRRRSQRLADARCADPHDIAEPDNNARPRAPAPLSAIRHRHHGSPRPRRELLRQRGDHPAGGRDRGRSATGVHRRRWHRVRAAAADGDQCGAHRGWASPGRSGRSHHQRGDAALGLTHPTGAAALPAERGERRQRPSQARPRPGRIRLAARSDAGQSARHRRGDGQDRAVAHLPAALTGHMACGAGEAPQFRTLHPIPFDRSRVLVQYDRPVGR